MTSVAIGYVHDFRGPSHSWYVSIWMMKNYDAERGHIIRAEFTDQLSKVDGIPAARNEVVRQFLASDCEWLLMVDRDMGFPPDALYRLLSAADPVDRPIVGALCFASWATQGDGMGGWRTEPMPTILRGNGDGLGTLELYPVDMVIRADATGAAFLLIHRSVLEKLERDWFTPFVKDGVQEMGEDVSFCVRAGRAGFPLHIHTGVKTSHHKDVWLSEADYWRSYRPPPATEWTGVVVNGEPDLDFVASLMASTGMASLDAADDESVPWLFLTGDDVTFAPGWLDHAQHVAKSFDADVVQVNGRGVLVRRELAVKFGDDWPGLVADAKERGTFQVALGAVVEVVR